MTQQGLLLKKDKRQYDFNFNSLTHFINKDLWSKKMNNKKKEFFYLELSSMLQAGMLIKDSMDVFIGEQTKPEEKKIFQNIVDDLIGGYSLFESLKRSRQFSPYEYYCIQIGEESGKLTDILKELADYYTERVKMMKQIIKSISYPIVILLSSLLATGFMITFIVPMFSSIFKRFGSDLPLVTKFFINVSSVLKEHILLIFLILIFLILSFIVLRKNESFRKKRQIFIGKLPYFGDMTKSIYMARFCSAMSLLIAARIPIVNAIALVRKMIDFYPIQAALEQVEKDLVNGMEFYKSLEKHKIFDAKMIALLKVGEEVNKMDVFFKKLHLYYSEEVDMKANALNTFLEPLIIIFLGLTVGAMLVAMYLPMFKLSNSIGY